MTDPARASAIEVQSQIVVQTILGPENSQPSEYSDFCQERILLPLPSRAKAHLSTATLYPNAVPAVEGICFLRNPPLHVSILK